MTRKYTYTIEQLKEAVKTSISVSQVLKKLNLAPAGGNYKIIQRIIKENSIDSSHFKGRAWSSGNKIGPKRDIQDYLTNKQSVQSFKLRNRLLQDKILSHQCMNCGLIKWLNQPIPLELHHVDGDSENNQLDNLQLLCPNCHTLTPNYRSKNKK